jgi:HSP20 family protein
MNKTSTSSKNIQTDYEDESTEGQLALDVYQTKNHIIIMAPIAGVKPDDMTISINDDVLTIKGKRNLEINIPEEDYFTQECFWGDFSRSIVLPSTVDSNKISAEFKDGILTIKIPKIEKARSKVIRIKTVK